MSFIGQVCSTYKCCASAVVVLCGSRSKTLFNRPVKYIIKVQSHCDQGKDYSSGAKGVTSFNNLVSLLPVTVSLDVLF